MGFHKGLYRCAGGLGSRFLYNAYKHVLEGGVIPALFAESRTVFISKSSDVDNNGRIVRSAEALRPLTLCNCDSKILTTAICRGLHWYTVRCIHPSQRCISSRQLTDNIFEIETAALAHVACAPRESGILPTDFAAAYPCVNHSWIFSCARENRSAQVHLPFPQKNLLRVHYTCGICRNAPWTIPHGQGCEARLPCERIPNLRWPSTPSFVGSRTRSFPGTLLVCTSFQPVPCAYADDFAVAASSFRCLMTALAPAFRVVDRIAGLNLNHRKCHWVQYGTSRLAISLGMGICELSRI